ncbi:MAG: CDP-diacylglycerol--serine O-phosphatidyltransferase [candidate division KSB1 bacterium]|nr:CDP-diacylglycerol--serine O-phosphatidyltransferase [candidate division KSB1 bacterium]
MNRKYLFPNTFTAGNLLCGFLSVLSAADHQYVTSAWLILLAAVFDALDGRVARAIRAYSPFGVEADSLADVVSFGLAPALLSYRVGLFKLGHIGLLLSFLPLLFASVRLARYNVQLKDLAHKSSFRGLPAPSASLAIATFVIAYSGNEPLPQPNILGVLIVTVAVLMVSNLTYEPLPKLSLRQRQSALGFGYLGLWIGLSLLSPKHFMFPIWMIYVLSGPARYAVTSLRRSAELGREEQGAPAERKDYAAEIGS